MAGAGDIVLTRSRPRDARLAFAGGQVEAQASLRHVVLPDQVLQLVVDAQSRLAQVDRVDRVGRHGNRNPRAGDDGFFGRSADQLFEVRADGNARPGTELNAVAADGAQRSFGIGLRIGAVDDLGIDARPDGIEHVAAGQVDRGGAVEVQIDVGPMGGNDRMHDLHHVATREVMRFQP